MTFGKRLAWPALHELCEYIELAHYQAASLVSGTVRKFTKDKKGQLHPHREDQDLITFVWSMI